MKKLSKKQSKFGYNFTKSSSTFQLQYKHIFASLSNVYYNFTKSSVLLHRVMYEQFEMDGFLGFSIDGRKQSIIYCAGMTPSWCHYNAISYFCIFALVQTVYHIGILLIENCGISLSKISCPIANVRQKLLKICRITSCF